MKIEKTGLVQIHNLTQATEKCKNDMKYIKLYENINDKSFPLDWQRREHFKKELEKLIDFLPDLYRKKRESWFHIINQPTFGPRPEGLRYIPDEEYRELAQAGKDLPYDRKKLLYDLYWALNPRMDDFVPIDFKTRSAKDLAKYWKVSHEIAFMMKCMYLRRLVLDDMPEEELDQWILETPTDMDLLSPEVRAGVLQRTGLEDISDLAQAMRRGLI